jgi:pyrroloquinoline quinone (PQQ) biosynthesis protein C
MTQPTYGHDLEAAIRGKFAQAQWLWAELSRLQDTMSLHRHPFQRRWRAGELSGAELQAFAGEHHHCVVALAGAARRAARLTDGLLAEQLSRYAEDQEDYVDLWCEFAVAAGWSRSSWYFAEDPLPQTVACARAWSGESRSLPQHLITLFAIESILADTARGQLKALSEHYRLDAQSIRYFSLRAERSAADLSLIQAAVTSLLPLLRPLALVRQAELTYRSYLELLSGIEVLAEASC